MLGSWLGVRPSGVVLQRHVGIKLNIAHMKKVIAQLAEFITRRRRLVSTPMANSRLQLFRKMA